MKRRAGTTLLLVLVSCGAKREPPPRLVILYAPCTVRCDFLGPYESTLASTPALATLARESVVFEKHVTECAQSGVAYAALFTGTQADRHGIAFHPSLLAAGNTTLAEVFAGAGYETWAWSGQPMASADLGYAQGIAPEHVRNHELRFQPEPQALAPGTLEHLAADDEDFRALLAQLAADPAKRAYVQVSFTVSHEPYHQYVSREEIRAFRDAYPAEARGVTDAELDRWLPVYEEHRHRLNWDFPAAREELALTDGDVERLAAVLELVYAACIHRLDGLVGDVLRAIDEAGLADETLFAFTADHGEVLWRPDALFPWTHGMGLEPEELHVPWLLRAPGLAPRRYAGVTRSIDVFPTLLGLAGVAVPEGVQGTDLSDVLTGNAEPPRQLAFAHNSILGERRLKRFADMDVLRRAMPAADPTRLWTAVRSDELFLRRRRLDPEPWRTEACEWTREQERELAPADDATRAALAAELERYQARLVEAQARAASTPLEESEELERLRALGYVR